MTNGFPDAERVLAAWPREAFEQLGGPDADTAVAALTHAPELDDEALILALRSPAFYVGAMGSRNTQRKRRERLAAAGLQRDRARIGCRAPRGSTSAAARPERRRWRSWPRRWRCVTGARVLG